MDYNTVRLVTPAGPSIPSSAYLFICPTSLSFLIHPSTYLSIYLSIRLPTHPSVHLCIHCPSFDPLTHSPTHLYTHPSLPPYFFGPEQPQWNITGHEYGPQDVGGSLLPLVLNFIGSVRLLIEASALCPQGLRPHRNPLSQFSAIA